MRPIALYLPQYHEIKENNEWWGQGYTEWNAVKDAKPLYRGHVQPKIPLNNNYYDLSDESCKTWKWQAELAREFGVFGFCIYHYWFNSNFKLLEKPVQNLLSHKEIDLKYMFCWANESWTRTWYGLSSVTLAEQTYGNENDWKIHFDYFLPFFLDERYIKINNKPVINILKTASIEKLGEMRALWDKLARENGFEGVYIVSANTSGDIENRVKLIDHFYNFEPGYTLVHRFPAFSKIMYYGRTFMISKYNKIFKKERLERKVPIKAIYQKSAKKTEKTFLGIVPCWDNTPRRSYKGTEYIGSSPQLFKKQLELINQLVTDDEYVYINAWNEWGEGCYLEPDTLTKYDYLKAIKEVVNVEN